LQRSDPNQRLGSAKPDGMEQLKAHPFFSEYDYNSKWSSLLNEKSPLEVKTKLCSRPKMTQDEVGLNHSFEFVMPIEIYRRGTS
jgi:hypothetical protein